MKPSRIAMGAVALLLLLVVTTSVASAEATWKNADKCVGVINTPGWTNAQTVHGHVHSKVWVNADEVTIDLWGYDTASSPIIAIIWLVIGLLVPMILGIFLGRMGYMIGAVMVMLGLSIMDTGWWWVSLLVIIQSGVMIMRGGMW